LDLSFPLSLDFAFIPKLRGDACGKVGPAPNQGEGIRPRTAAKEAEMHHLLLKTSVAGICALAFLAAHGPAKAVSPLSLNQAAPLVIPVVDQENLAVEEDLRPDEPPEALMGETPKKPMMAPPPEETGGQSSGNIEDEMINKIGPGAE
jgi:hypothetical protein